MRRYLLYFAVAVLAFGASVFIASMFLRETKETLTHFQKVEEIGTAKELVESEEIERRSKPLPDVSLFEVSAITKEPIATGSGDWICEDYILKKIAKEKAKDSRVVKLKDFDPDKETLSPELREWFQPIRKESFEASELRHKEKRVLIFHSIVLGATNYAANFESWYINLESHPIEFRSLSINPEFIFWDKNGLLNYYTVKYGESFLENKDPENLTLDFSRYRVNSKGKSQLVSRKPNVKCQ